MNPNYISPTVLALVLSLYGPDTAAFSEATLRMAHGGLLGGSKTPATEANPTVTSYTLGEDGVLSKGNYTDKKKVAPGDPVYPSPRIAVAQMGPSERVHLPDHEVYVNFRRSGISEMGSIYLLVNVNDSTQAHLHYLLTVGPRMQFASKADKPLSAPIAQILTEDFREGVTPLVDKPKAHKVKKITPAANAQEDPLDSATTGLAHELCASRPEQL